MLGKSYSINWLTRNLVPQNRWKPYPRISDRRAWLSLPSSQRKAIVRHGLDNLAKSWPELPATLYLDFARTGNRRHFEAPWFERRQILAALTLAECVENKGRFTDAIINAIWSICEESSWCFPAHVGGQKAGVGLPDTTEPIVDLFAAETASQLAWTRYLLDAALDRASPLVMPRIEREIIHRILTPCLQRDDFWWLGFKGRHVNNWNPWINSNWLSCALLIEPDNRRRIQAVAKILRSLAVFTDSYPDDGGCDEGPSYWTRAGASLFDNLDLLHRATRGRLDLFKHPKVREIGRFIYRAHIADRWFLNFADAPAIMTAPAGLVFRFGRRIADPAMQSLARYFHAGRNGQATGTLLRTLPDLFDSSGLDRKPAKPPLPRDVWLPDTQVMVARSFAGRTTGLTLAAKGGHNAESHNHNDVGHFVLFHDGNPVLVDAGVETYTRKTFSPQRYTLWTMQSAYHNLPTINGVMQQNGREFQARNLCYKATHQTVDFSLDIAPAYPAQAGLTSWVRSLHLDRGELMILKDGYQSHRNPKQLEWSFLTPCRPVLKSNGIQLTDRSLPGKRISGTAMLTYDTARMTSRVEPVTITDDRLKAIWGGQLFRIRLQARHPKSTDQYQFEIRPATPSGR